MSFLLQYWRSLSSREQSFLAVGGLAAAAIMAYVLAWEPWHHELQQLRERVPAERASAAWMTQEANGLRPLLAQQKKSKTGTNVPLLTVIEETARQAGLRDAIRQMQPGEGDEVKVWLQDVYFDPWVKWIDTLSRQGIAVSSVSITRSQQPNMVNVRATLQRTG
jgi:type II secretory pathway component PulM